MVPSSFLCPLTGEVMREPVAICDGNVYDRHAIEAWLRNSNGISPGSGKSLESQSLSPMPALQAAIEAFMMHPSAPRRWQTSSPISLTSGPELSSVSKLVAGGRSNWTQATGMERINESSSCQSMHADAAMTSSRTSLSSAVFEPKTMRRPRVDLRGGSGGSQTSDARLGSSGSRSSLGTSKNKPLPHVAHDASRHASTRAPPHTARRDQPLSAAGTEGARSKASSSRKARSVSPVRQETEDHDKPWLHDRSGAPSPRSREQSPRQSIATSLRRARSEQPDGGKTTVRRSRSSGGTRDKEGVALMPKVDDDPLRCMSPRGFRDGNGTGNSLRRVGSKSSFRIQERSPRLGGLVWTAPEHTSETTGSIVSNGEEDSVIVMTGADAGGGVRENAAAAAAATDAPRRPQQRFGMRRLSVSQPKGKTSGAVSNHRIDVGPSSPGARAGSFVFSSARASGDASLGDKVRVQGRCGACEGPVPAPVAGHANSRGSTHVKPKDKMVREVHAIQECVAAYPFDSSGQEAHMQSQSLPCNQGADWPVDFEPKDPLSAGSQLRLRTSRSAEVPSRFRIPPRQPQAPPKNTATHKHLRPSEPWCDMQKASHGQPGKVKVLRGGGSIGAGAAASHLTRSTSNRRWEEARDILRELQQAGNGGLGEASCEKVGGFASIGRPDIVPLVPSLAAQTPMVLAGDVAGGGSQGEAVSHRSWEESLLHSGQRSPRPEVAQTSAKHEEPDPGQVALTSIDDFGRTSLMHAAWRGSLADVRAILSTEGGQASVDALDECRCTALMYSATFGHEDVVRCLLEHNAVVEAPSRDGWTPLIAAAYNGHVRVVRHLLQQRANIEAADVRGWTPLMHVAFNGDNETLRCLVDHRAALETCDLEGRTPLVYAALKGHLSNVKCLMDKALKDARHVRVDGAWDTAILFASVQGHVEVVRLLLEAGIASSETRNAALKLAADHAHHDVVELLVRRSAVDSFGI